MFLAESRDISNSTEVSAPTTLRNIWRNVRRSHLATAVVAGSATILVVGGAALASGVAHQGSSKGHAAATPKSQRIPAAGRRQAAVGQQVWNGFVDFIDPLDSTAYLGIGGSAHAATVPGNIGTMVVIAGTLGNFRARLASTPSSGTVTFTAYTNAPSTVTCTITPPDVSCSDAIHTLALAADKSLKVRVVNTGTGPLYGARWSATYTAS